MRLAGGRSWEGCGGEEEERRRGGAEEKEEEEEEEERRVRMRMRQIDRFGRPRERWTDWGRLAGLGGLGGAGGAGWRAGGRAGGRAWTDTVVQVRSLKAAVRK